MSDFENFAASEGQESDPQAVERLRERMRANSAKIKKLKKDEGKQKKKENDLIKIIVQYLQSQQKRDIMLLVLRCLAQEIPPVFVLAIISLTEDDLQSFEESQLTEVPESVYTRALGRIGIGESTLSLKAMLRLSSWVESLNSTANAKGTTIPKTLKDHQGDIKVVALQLTSFILREFLENQKSEVEFKKLQAFSQFILSGICSKIQKEMTEPKSE